MNERCPQIENIRRFASTISASELDQKYDCEISTQKQSLAIKKICGHDRFPGIRLPLRPAEGLGLDINFLGVTSIPNLIKQNNPVPLLKGHDGRYGASRRRRHHVVYHCFGQALINANHLNKIGIGYIETV